MECLIDTVVKKRICLYVFLKLRAMYEVRMKKHCPSSDVRPFPIVFPPPYLTGGDTYQGAVPVIIPTASICEIKVIVVLDKHTVYAIMVKTGTYRRYFREIDHRYQGMRVGESVIAAVIGRFLNFKDLGHRKE